MRFPYMQKGFMQKKKIFTHFCAHEFFMFTVMSQNTYNLYPINAALSEYEA